MTVIRKYATENAEYLKRGVAERIISRFYQLYEVDNKLNEGVMDLDIKNEGKTIYEARMLVLKYVSRRIGVSLDDTQYDESRSGELIKKSDISDALSQLRKDFKADVGAGANKAQTYVLRKPQTRKEKLAANGLKTIDELAMVLGIDLVDINDLHII